MGFDAHRGRLLESAVYIGDTEEGGYINSLADNHNLSLFNT
jgi:hypothetical protein